MEPGEALGIAAQIAVALAGFAGVVVVFRRESVHEWSLLDKLRLRLLLANSILPLGLNLLRRLGVVKPAVVHGQSTAAMLGINFDEAMAELNIAPGVILLRLNRRRKDRIDSND